MAIGPAPDWTQVTWLIGNYEGIPTLTAVDGDGNIIAKMMGMSPAGLQPIAVDANGQIIMVPIGQSGNYMLVDANGYLTSVMKGDDAGTLRTIAVDSDGNIVGVFKGLYDATLKALRVDSDGRLIAILTDPEDEWGVFKQMGFAGLSRTLTFAKRYDHRGTVFFATSFEDGIAGWGQYTSGTGAAIRFSVQQAKFGAFSCELVAGKDSDRYARIKRYFHYPVLGKIGLEFSFTLDPDTNQVRAWLQYYDGTNVNRFNVLYDHTNAALKCGKHDGTHTTLNGALSLYVGDETFHTIKLVVDLETIAFVRVLCDGSEYDASAAAVSTTADTSAERLEVDIEHKGIVAPAVNPNVWVDDIILTEGEP